MTKDKSNHNRPLVYAVYIRNSSPEQNYLSIKRQAKLAKSLLANTAFSPNHGCVVIEWSRRR